MALSYGFCLGEASAEDTAAQFAEAFQAVVGDGICAYGGKFAVQATDSLTINVNTGFALAAGRWFKLDETESQAVSIADNDFDRYDAVVICIDLAARVSSLKLVTGKPEAFPKKYAPIRDENKYELVLAYILIKKGTTLISQKDIEDTRADRSLCGDILDMANVAVHILKVYGFFDSGIDKEVARLMALAAGILQKGDDAVQAITQAMLAANIGRTIGELTTLHEAPVPIAAWLQCDGRSVPLEYLALHTALGGVLPAITPADTRFRTYIYGGSPI